MAHKYITARMDLQKVSRESASAKKLVESAAVEATEVRWREGSPSSDRAAALPWRTPGRGRDAEVRPLPTSASARRPRCASAAAAIAPPPFNARYSTPMVLQDDDAPEAVPLQDGASKDGNLRQRAPRRRMA